MNNFIKILPAAAIVVGLVGSAFTSTQKAPTKSAQQQLHWYQFDAANNVVGNQIGTEMISKEDAEAATGCEPLVSPDCARGYTSAQTPGQPQSQPQSDYLSFQD